MLASLWKSVVDTRTKILDTDRALAAALAAKADGKTLVISVGEYDPVLAEHAERLAGRKSGRENAVWHAVAVLPGVATLLPLRARCELVAALTCVDAVVPFEQDPLMLSMVAGKAEIHDDRKSDADARTSLITHIHAKQKLAAE